MAELIASSSAVASEEAMADKEDTRIYECAILYPFGLSQKDEQQAMKDVEAFFEEVGAKLIAKDNWGRRGIAYPIKGSLEATIIIYHFDMDPLKVKEVDQALKIHKGVLRHMFVKPPKGYQILKYSEVYEKWLKERESRDQVQAREKEEKVREQIAKKAKRQAERVAEEKKVVEKKPALEGEALTEKLEKLISDDTTDL